MRTIISDSERSILIAMAKCDLNIARVAEMCGYSRMTIYDKLLSIEAKTGTNPHTFDGLVKLLKSIGYFEEN